MSPTHWRPRTALAHAAVVAALATGLVGCAGDGPNPFATGSPKPSASDPQPVHVEIEGSKSVDIQASPPGPDGVGFVAFGDFGGGPMQGQVSKAMQVWAEHHPVDALVTTGDNVYPSGDPALFDDQLDDPYTELRATRPLWVTLGNHDVAGGHGDEQLEYLDLPELPYAQELPGVQLLFLDANRPDAEQAQWVDARLSEPGPPFRVVVFHQPAFSCSIHGATPAVIAEWVSVFEAHHVDVVLNGHDHLYEHFLKAGVHYVVTGGGGRDLYPFKEQCAYDSLLQGQAEEHHFVGVEVGEDGAGLSVTAIAADGRVLDQFEIAG